MLTIQVFFLVRQVLTKISKLCAIIINGGGNMFRLLKLYFSAIFNAPKNIEQAMEIKRKQQELINKQYEEMKKVEKK